jgi:6,7-dimethyl-8-ribityllumazine synthase
MAMPKIPHLLIVEARFYDDMSDALLDGAKSAWKRRGDL